MLPCPRAQPLSNLDELRARYYDPELAERFRRFKLDDFPPPTAEHTHRGAGVYSEPQILPNRRRR